MYLLYAYRHPFTFTGLCHLPLQYIMVRSNPSEGVPLPAKPPFMLLPILLCALPISSCCYCILSLSVQQLDHFLSLIRTLAFLRVPQSTGAIGQWLRYILCPPAVPGGTAAGFTWGWPHRARSLMAPQRRQNDANVSDAAPCWTGGLMGMRRR